MKFMPLDAVFGSIVFFLSFRDRLQTRYDELFGGTSEIGGLRQGFGHKWGWYQSIYSLAKGDIRRFKSITKLNVNECLTMLAFLKDKAEVENKIIKQKFKQ